MLSKKTVGKENITNDGPGTLIFFSTQNHAYSILVLAPSTTGAANIPAVVMKHLEKLHPLEFYTYKTTFLVSKNF